MIGLPSSKIFAAAAQQPAEPPAGEPSKANGASRPSSQSLTPSVEMAPLIEATLEDELDEEVAEPVTVPRKRAPTPPPPPVVAKEPAKDSPPSRKWEPTQKVDPMPITPAMRSSGELPVGTFMYPSARRSSGLLKWLLLLFALGAGFGAVVFVAPRLMKQDDGTKQATQVAQTTPPPAPPAPPVPPADQPVPESPSTPSAEQAAPPPTTETNSPASDTNPTTTTTPTTTPPTPPTTTRSTHSRSTSKQTTKVTAKTSPTASGPTQPTDTNPSPPSDTKPAEPKGDPTCDEVSCVLSKYDRPCCERYKPKETAIAKRSGSVPEELDRAAVRASIDKVKPAVVACGEKAGVKGTVKIAVAVAPEGNVTSADVAESPDAALGSCVASAIKRAKFTKTINGGSFTYPFVF
jgi:TonB family protein